MDQFIGVCPVCKGTTRVPLTPREREYKDIIAGYDPETDTLACHNCGGQVQFGAATGKVPLRKDGTPCIHEVEGKKLGNCYYRYTCKHCGFNYTIDSGD